MASEYLKPIPYNEVVSKSIQEGTYKQVCLLNGNGTSIFSLKDQAVAKKEQFGAFLERFKRNQSTKSVSDISRATLAVDYHVLGTDDFPQPAARFDDIRERVRLATSFHTIVKYYQRNEHEEREHAKDIGVAPPKRRLGLILSDMLELMPSTLSAQLLLSTSDGGISSHVKESLSRIWPHDEGEAYSEAVEAAVLLPDSIREEIWRQMAKLNYEQAGALLTLISSNFNRRQSLLSAYNIIYRNLEGEQAQSHLNNLYPALIKAREIINGEKPKPGEGKGVLFKR